MRVVKSFNDSWYFSKSDVFPVEISKDFEEVVLPHTWNALDGQDGGNDYHRGTCHYVKKFTKDELPVNDEYYLEIEGANASADVFLNGKKLAHHDGGYSTFRVNLTEALEEDNTLVIAVDNSINDIVYPQMADFTFYGGLYRDVNLICVNKSHFDLDYYGGPGIKVTPTLKDNKALIEVEVYGDFEEEVTYKLFDKEGNELLSKVDKEKKIVLELDNPHLWHGRKDPYLYTVKANLSEDEVCTRIGIRTFEIDADRGFILNGEEYPLRGVSRHQDFKRIGNALLKEHHKRDMELIYEVGANTIRLAHYQHNQYFYDLCDEYGMVVWAEIPYISKHMPNANDNTKSQMKELVIQNYNHPSIVVWGLSNEITISTEADENLMNNHIELNDLVHALDSTRLTTMACVSMLKTDSPLIKVPDVVSYNHYFGWYGGKTEMNGPWFDKFHEEHPNIPIGLSEYGCEALNWHTSNPTQGDYTEEYQAYYHEELIKQISTRKYLWATHVWNMFDFGADARAEGGENGQNHKGLVTFDREYKKDSFYAYKAWLSEEKFVHLCGKRYVDRVEEETKVTVYSNLDEVELYLNDELYENKTSDNHFFYFTIPNVGKTKITVKAGEYSDEGFINKVDEMNEDYVLKEAGAILNWFDVTVVEGHFSLNDTIGDIMANEKGRALLGGLMQNMMSNQSHGGFEIGEEVAQMLNGFTVVRMVNMMGTMANIEIPKDKLLELNAMLNQIPKE